MSEASTPDRRCIGIVLAGGQSRRMGRDKALLEYGDATLLQHQVNTLAQVCDQVVVSGDYPDYDCLHDTRPGMGPLSGIHAAAKRFDTQALLFLPVDMPAMTPDALRKLLAHGGPCHFEAQPLPCLLSDAFAVLAAIEKIWDSGDDGYAVKGLHRALASQSIGFSKQFVFLNINTPSHWNHFNSPATTQ